MDLPEVGFSGLGSGQMTGACEQENEPSGSVNFGSV
jgi:hypothetical protein